MPQPARIAIDLGAESCRVSLLRFVNEEPSVTVLHRIPNGPERQGDSLHWPLTSILAGLEEGLRKAAVAAPEGIASISVDSWSVDYVRIGPDGKALREPFSYRDERTMASKEAVDKIIHPYDLYQRTGAIPLRINTAYQLVADRAAGIDPRTRWAMFPEFVLYWLSGRRVAEYTNASHTGLVNLKTGDWDAEVFRLLDLSLDAAPPIVRAGTVLGPLQGPLKELDAFRETQIIAPACHDTASAIAGIPASLSSTAYLCTGTWSLMGTITDSPVTTSEAYDAGYTNIGAATGGLCFHSLINGMWMVKQCMDRWSEQGRSWSIAELVQKAAECSGHGVIDVNAEPLMLEGNMPERINNELRAAGHHAIADTAGNEPLIARVIFESLAARFAAARNSLESMLGRRFDRIHMLGGATRNKLLIRLTEEKTGLPVTVGEAESSTIGNLALQLAASQACGNPVTGEAVREWAARLCQTAQQPV